MCFSFFFFAEPYLNIDDGEFGIHSKLNRFKVPEAHFTTCKTTSSLRKWILHRSHCSHFHCFYSKCFDLICYNRANGWPHPTHCPWDKVPKCMGAVTKLWPSLFAQMGWIVLTLAGWRARQRFACVSTIPRRLQCQLPRRNSRSLASGEGGHQG